MKILKKVLIFLLLIIIISVSILLLLGYSHYTVALKEKPLVTRVEEITSRRKFCFL